MIVGKPQNLVQWLFNQDKEKLFEIKEYKEKRSLSQNAYAWKLITELANQLRKSKEEVYMQMLKDYGQSTLIVVANEINIHGYIKYYEKIKSFKNNNRTFIEYKVFKGSSEFDSKEMSIFIDGIIQECKQLGIETLNSDEIARLEII